MTILTQLVKFGESIASELPPPGYAELTVYYQIRLNPDGSFYLLEPLETAQFDHKGKPKKPKAGRKYDCPHIRRNALQPKLITDTAKYVLGDGPENEAYLALLERCYRETNESAVKAILAFLQTKPSLEIDPSLAVMFAIKDESILVHDLPSVQRFWARYVDELTGENRLLGQCLATGEVAPITTKFALQVKGVPGTNAQGGSLLSAYLDSCSSYGLEGALVSPLSVQADELLSQALSYLLRKQNHHIAIANIVYAFWSDSGLASGDLFGTPNSQAVKDYLSQFQQSKQNIDPDWQFYILALTGNAGRIVVRDWVEIQEPNFAAHYQKWLDSQILNSQAQNDSSQPHFLPGYGREWSDKSGDHRWGYLSIWQLARAGVRESKEILPRTVNSIVRNAIYGEPLPIAFIQNICHRNRIEGVELFSSLSYARSLALNMYIHSLQRRNQVTPTHEIAFQYGRLLGVHALLEQEAKTNKKKGQYFQLTNTNAMKAYASAGCSPLPMSHRLGSGATHHLALFESWQFKTMQSYVERLAEINAKIADLTEKTDIPQVFDTNAQAHFDLGFWSELHRKTKEADKSDTQSNADD